MNNSDQQAMEEALENCAKEAIHQIGLVQPHGALMVITPKAPHMVIQASENLIDFLGLSVSNTLDKALVELLGAKATKEVEQLIASLDRHQEINEKIIIQQKQTTSEFQLHIFASNDSFVLEFTIDSQKQVEHIEELFFLKQQYFLDTESEKDIFKYFDHLSSFIRELSGFDRVMVYRFDSNWDGEVIAESRTETATSYLGTHFPASDIPAQARELYTRKLIRYVANIDEAPVPVFPTLNPITQQALDLSYSNIRALSPVHVEYLHNMGVKASMSISLLQNGKLWGLIACHHMTAINVSLALIKALKIISRSVSIRLAWDNTREFHNLSLNANKIIGELLSHITAGSEKSILWTLLPKLLEILSATGVLVVIEGKNYTQGIVPEENEIKALLSWLGSQSNKKTYSSEYLLKSFPRSAPYAELASGLLASPITTDMRNCIVWFRKEKIRSVRWAGKPEKDFAKDKSGIIRLSPRNSFKTWSEEWRNRCKPWSNAEAATAELLTLALTEGLAQKSRLDTANSISNKTQEALLKSQKKTSTVLQELEYYKYALDQHAIVAMTDIAGTITYVNDKFAEISGYAKHELIGQNHRLVNSGKHSKEFFTKMFQTISNGKVWKGEICNRTKSGSLYWVMTTIVPFIDKQGNPQQYISIRSDITENKIAEEQLRISATSFETNEAIMITDANANIIRVNHAFERITGYSQEEVQGKNPKILSAGFHDKSFYHTMWKTLLDNGSWTGEIFDKRKNGQVYPKWLTITAVKDHDGITTEYVAIFSDISHRKKAEEEIYSLAFYDHLTKLPNRRFLLDRIHHALSLSERSKSFGALLFLDMDKFKELNDTLGHDFGDLLLIEVSKRIQQCVRDIDTVARIGGDEFVVLIEEISLNKEIALQNTAMIAEKIRATLAEPYQLDGYEHYSSPSIGVCLYIGNKETVDLVLKYADMAMYQAKESGRNMVRFYDPAMQQAVEERASLESDMRHAISKQQLHLYYQIQLDAELRPIGAEALIRWQHPSRGLVSPAQFIPVAEDSTLILDIGQWVIETACKQLALWSKNKHTRDLILSINVSAQQFKKHNFVDLLKSILDSHQVNPSRLKLELTESVVLDNVDDVIAKMHALRRTGIRLSLDDFGTGYSSLSYLKRLPLDEVKIDQSFVRDITRDESDAIMVKTIITLAHNFKLKVIAEGVETEEQFSFLKQNHCMKYQGYLFSKPIPINEFEALLSKMK